MHVSGYYVDSKTLRTQVQVFISAYSFMFFSETNPEQPLLSTDINHHQRIIHQLQHLELELSDQGEEEPPPYDRALQESEPFSKQVSTQSSEEVQTPPPEYHPGIRGISERQKRNYSGFCSTLVQSRLICHFQMYEKFILIIVNCF